MSVIKNKADQIEIQIHSTTSIGEIKILIEELSNLSLKLNQILKLVNSKKWIWENEKRAWDFSFTTSLIWNKKCQQKVVNSMKSYWMSHGPKNEWSMEKMMSGYMKYYLKYIQPVYSPNK
jgi:hypothetical protein